MNKINIFSILLVFFSTPLFSQSQPILPVSFPSPEATNLGIVGNIPVNYHTGMVNISIPFSVGDDNKAIPMSLSYNSSGILPDLHPGWVGLNWTLNVGGVITRVQKGELDEYPHGFFNNPDKLGTTVWALDANLSPLQYFPYTTIFGGTPETFDTEPDEFIFNVNGIHGKFYMDNQGSFRVASQPNLKVEFNSQTDIGLLSNLGTTILGFTLVADDGTRYRFGNNTSNIIYDNKHNLIETNTTSAPVGSPLPNGVLHATSWMLSEIIYPNHDKTTFEYTDKVDDYNGYYLTQSIATNAKYTSTGEDQIASLLNSNCGQIANGVQWSVTSHMYLKSIDAPNYTITFKTSKSTELRSQLDSQIGGNWQQLDSINVSDKATGKRQKSYVFKYTNDTNTRLFLQTVKTLDSSGKNSLPPYKFSYNEGTLDDYYTKKRDHWGYYNLNPQGYTLPTQVAVDGYSYYWYDREPNSQTLLIGSLKQIDYPTGGKVAFEFEPNEYSRYLDVSFIKPYTVSTGETISHPSVDVTASSPLVLLYPADVGFTLSPSMKSTNGSRRIEPGTYTLSYLSSLLNSGNPTGDTHAYTTYTEYVTRLVTQPGTLIPITRSWNYHTSYDVSATSSLVLSGPSDVGITLMPSGTSSNGFKTLSQGTYSLQNLITLVGGNPSDTHAYITYWELAPALKTLGAGLRIKKIHYKNSDSEDIYHEFSYSPFNPDSALYTSGILGSLPQYYCNVTSANTPLLSYSSSQTLTPVRLSQGAAVGYSNVTETIKDKNGVSLGFTTYKYSNFDSNPDLPPVNVLTSLSGLLGQRNSKEYERGLLLQQTVYNKDRNVVKLTINSYTNTNDLPINAVNVRSLLSCPFGPSVSLFSSAVSAYLIPMETRKLTKQIETIYDINGNNPVSNTTRYSYNQYQLPSTVTVATSRSTTDSIRISTSYPFDNTLTLYARMKKKNMLNYPVETINYLNSNVTGSKLTTYKELINNVDTMYLPDKSYDLAISSSLPVFSKFNGSTLDYHYGIPKIEFVSYDVKGNIREVKDQTGLSNSFLWSYNNQYPVAKIEGISYTDLANNYYSQSNIDALANTANPTTDQLNAIRTALANKTVLITTYTYSPLIGTVTATNPRGVTTNYTYDTFNRLQAIKDLYGRVIQSFDYNYQH